MKPLYFLIMLVPFLAFSQDVDQRSYLLHENVLLTPNLTSLSDFREGLLEHNEKYHSQAPYGARVYYISSGPNSGSYMWVMGPFPWNALDADRDDREEHLEDWEENVQPYLLPGSNTSYWRFHPEISAFGEELELDKLLVRYYDVKAFEEERMLKLVEMAALVMREKFPKTLYTTYTNIFPSHKEGKDLALVFFFDSYSWLEQDPHFRSAYEEIYGSEGLEEFLASWQEVNLGEETEIWIFQPELSGLDGTVEVEN